MKKIVTLLCLVVLCVPAYASAEIGNRHWPGTGERTLRVYNNLPTGMWQTELNTVLAKWSTSPYINLVNAGRRTYSNDCVDGLSFVENEIDLCFNRTTTASWLGLASVFGSGDHISYVNIDINASKGFGATKMRWTLAHEFGHGVGLFHEATCNTSVMVTSFTCANSKGTYLPRWADFQDVTTMHNHAG